MRVKENTAVTLNSLVLGVFILFLLLNKVNVFSGKALLLIILAVNIYQLFRLRDNQALVICLIFAMTYWVYMLPYYFVGIPYCTYLKHGNITLQETNGALRITGLFMGVLFGFIKPKQKKRIRDILPKRYNPIVYAGCLLAMLLIILRTFRAGGTFSYKVEGVNSSIYEYYFIFALMAFCYAKKRRLYIILLVTNAVYIVALLRLGLRLVVLQILLMVFLEYFEKKFKNTVVIFTSFAGFIFMSFWSLFRSGMTSGGLNLQALLGLSEGYLVSNQGDVFYTSSAQFAQVSNGGWGIAARVKSFLGFFANIFLLPKYQIPEGKLNVMLDSVNMPVPGGGFGAVYAYVWVGVIGVVLLALYISHFINVTYTTNSGIKRIYGVFLVFTFFRWYAYNLAIVFKMGFWLLLVHAVIIIFDKIVRRRRQDERRRPVKRV